MGKSLKGRELGVGISQRKDGTYMARFTDRGGKRRQKYFKKLQQCRNWLADAQYADEHGSINAAQDLTVDEWFQYWISEIKERTIGLSTLNGYRDRYKKNIKDVIGNMLIRDVKPMNCQNILNIMDNDKYSEGTMMRTKITMSAMFSAACENDIIPASPITRSVKCPKRKKRDVRVLTCDEQDKFLAAARRSINYNHFLFILQTGVRSSELRGLQWRDVDFENRVIHVRRNVTYDSRSNKFILGELKTASSQRDIPMTETVYRLLIDMKRNRTDVLPIEFADHIFLNSNGRLTANSGYDQYLKSICNNAKIPKISMHTLRHTFATRCIEAGMKPKTLQKILGHSSIAMTLDRYVHLTSDEQEREMKKFEKLFGDI